MSLSNLEASLWATEIQESGLKVRVTSCPSFPGTEGIPGIWDFQC